VLADVCAGVDAAHARLMVHRDLKPENIFLVADGPAKVLDFGIATIVPPGLPGDAVTATAVVIGTLAYMAPEQVAGGVASPAWDLWALGVIAYEMLVGTHPFAAVPPFERIDAMRQGRYALPSAALGGAGAGWDAFFARAFHPDADARFASARVLAAAAATA
jgi:serine/threonine-protein kinase